MYDFSSKKVSDLTFLSKGRVVDFTFSATGQEMYFIEESQDNQQTIHAFYFSTKTYRNIAKVNASQLLMIDLKGNFLMVADENTVFVWNLFSEESCGSYSSSLTSAGLSPDGSNLIIYEKGNGVTTVYRICSNKSEYFNSAVNFCQPCKSPCG